MCGGGGVSPLAHLVTSKARYKTRASDVVSAADAIGPIEKNMILTGITKGGFSMLDVIEYCLRVTGPADVDVSTWTAGVYDLDVLWNFVETAAIRSIRFMVDPAMFNVSQSRHAPAFLAAFGGDALRAIDNHAKFTLISNPDWHLTICSSMNLNRNKRLENFCLFEGAGVWEFYRDIVDRVFSQLAPLDATKKISQSEFQKLSLTDEPAAPPAAPCDQDKVRQEWLTLIR